jgi:hypothetical protein
MVSFVLLTYAVAHWLILTSDHETIRPIPFTMWLDLLDICTGILHYVYGHHNY